MRNMLWEELVSTAICVVSPSPSYCLPTATSLKGAAQSPHPKPLSSANVTLLTHC